MTELEQELEALRAEGEAAPTVKEMNDLAEEIARLRSEEDEASDKKKAITAKLEAAENKMVELLITNNLKNYRAPAGLASLSFRTSVKTPKTPEQKTLFFEYLRKTGRYDDMVSVNSQTLNSFYKEQLELAKERGEDDVQIPGITEITVNPNLSFKRPR